MSKQTDKLIEYLKVHGRTGSWDELAQKFGISTGGVARTTWGRYRKLKKIEKKQKTAEYITALEDKVIELEEDIKNNTAELTLRTKDEVENLEDLIKKAKIDTKVWHITKYVQNYWGNSSSPHWQVKAFLEKRKLDTDINLQKDYLLAAIKQQQGKVPTRFPKRPTITGKKYLLEISIPDLHIGKLAWGKESGEDYDIDISVERFKNAIAALLASVPLENVERIMMPIGNDLLHVDNSENTTTAGTYVDTDGRFAKIVQVARKLIVDTVLQLRQIAPVDLIIVRGNHDSVSSFMLGEILDAWFHTYKDVNVDNSPKWRKYYQYGKVGIQLTHGDKEKHSELGNIFATEEPKLWADTKFRFCKLGHLHRSKKISYISVDSFPGFQIEVIPSLSGTDEWHSSNGYMSLKQAKAFLYHKEEGEVGAFTHTV